MQIGKIRTEAERVAIAKRADEAYLIYNEMYDEALKTYDPDKYYLTPKFIQRQFRGYCQQWANQKSWENMGLEDIAKKALDRNIIKVTGVRESFDTFIDAMSKLTPNQIEELKLQPYELNMDYDEDVWLEAKEDFITLKDIWKKFVTRSDYRAAIIDCMWYATKNSNLIHSIYSGEDTEENSKPELVLFGKD